MNAYKREQELSRISFAIWVGYRLARFTILIASAMRK